MKVINLHYRTWVAVETFIIYFFFTCATVSPRSRARFLFGFWFGFGMLGFVFLHGEQTASGQGVSVLVHYSFRKNNLLYPTLIHIHI